MKRIFFCIALVLICMQLRAQDTFSIVAVDSATGEVGSAGASCVNLFATGFNDHFLGDLLPGVGAINTQAYYLQGNQTNARTRLQAGDTPQQAIDWLVANDIQGNASIRQYGIVSFVNGSPQAAAHTGGNTNDFKGHRVGPNYSIQGNILLGAQVLDSMESRFLSAPGDLSCKLMAAMQGANMVGADTRCASNGSSSLFAFVKVSQANDPYNAPSFLVSVRTQNGAGIEPLDTLQTLFDAVKSCTATAVSGPEPELDLRIYPSPASDYLRTAWGLSQAELCRYEIWDALGCCVLQVTDVPEATLSIGYLPSGLYWLQVTDGDRFAAKAFVKQ